MAHTGFIFPGQGSQTVGMGVELAAESAAARAVFDEVDDALGENLFQLMAEGPEEQLRLTRNAQPALFASSLAVVRALQEATGQTLAQLGIMVAGHSLGEYAALASVGTLNIPAAARLLRLRGDSMQAAVPVGSGAMAALLGAGMEQAAEFVAAGSAAGLVQIANDNAPGQIVISGELAAIEAAMQAARDGGLRRVMQLPVSAPFHCELMAPAAAVMAEALADTDLQTAQLPVYCNVTAAPETEAARLRDNLVEQVTGRVRWRETLAAMQQDGAGRFIELGTSKVLSGLVKRTLEGVEIANIERLADIEGLW
jgi:[acyl-carrier-protein] S-malonyltransferase